ncbi:MAG TPA: hypothetical protein VFD92_17970 [Candidatus Binatia bacterium]|nr:hypothetical protein [Candidatus Binatia bacterium]
MRASALLLSLAALLGCGSPAGVRPSQPATVVKAAPLAEVGSFTASCDPAEHRLMRVADGRVEPVVFCN